MIIEFQGGEVFQKGQYYRNSERFLYIYNSSQLQYPGKRRMRETPQNGKMNRKELAKEMSRRHSMTTEEAKRILELVQTITEEAMERGEEVRLSGFGIFRITDRAARTAYNPNNREPVQAERLVRWCERSGAHCPLLLDYVTKRVSTKDQLNGRTSSSSSGRSVKPSGTRAGSLFMEPS